MHVSVRASMSYHCSCSYPVLASGVVVNENGACTMSHSNPLSISGVKLMVDTDCTYRGSDIIASDSAALVIGPHSVFTVTTPVNIYASTADAGEVVNGGTLILDKQGSLNTRVPVVNRGDLRVCVLLLGLAAAFVCQMHTTSAATD